MRVDYPDRARQRLRGLARVRQPVLAGVYLADAQGRIRHHQFGEGGYEESERVIQQLLAGGRTAEASGRRARLGRRRRASRRRPTGRTSSLPRPTSATSEGRELRLSGRCGRSARPTPTPCPQRLALNQWALAGDWTITRGRRGARSRRRAIAFRFHARDVHLVMGPARGWHAGAVPGAHRRTAARRRPRARRGRRRATGRSASSGCTSSSASRHRSASDVRDHVPRPGRRGLRLHLRLMRNELSSPSRPARRGMSSATCRRDRPRVGVDADDLGLDLRRLARELLLELRCCSSPRRRPRARPRPAAAAPAGAPCCLRQRG